MSSGIRSARARRVAEMFGVRDVKPGILDFKAQIPDLKLEPGTITLISGASGSGKSSLLRALRLRHGGHRWVDVGSIVPREVAVVDCFDSDDLVAVLMMLGRLGLGEVWTYLRTPGQLSEGQRWRLRLALALWRMRETGGILAADEFCTMLDRLTARIVARCLRKTIDSMPHIGAVVASGHADVRAALRPDRELRCDFGTVSAM